MKMRFVVTTVAIMVGFVTVLLVKSRTVEDSVVSDDAVTAPVEDAVHEEHPALSPNAAPSLPPVDVVVEEKSESERDKKVEERLERFIEKTAGMTPESLAEEREHIAQGLKRALSKKTEMPEIYDDRDSSGNLWEERRYQDGIVRYFPKHKE